MSEPVNSMTGSGPTGTVIRRSRASLGRLLSFVVCLICVGAGGVYWWTFGGGEKWWHNAWLPVKVEFRGKVTLDGKPLRGGQLLTWPDRRGVPRSMGIIGQDGEFQLLTDIDGRFVEQAFAGRHRVSVLQFAPQVGATAPRLTSPAKYSSPDTSGLEVTVDRDPAKNFAVVALISDSPKSNDQPLSGETQPPDLPTPNSLK